jgi:hypothetical protein
VGRGSGSSECYISWSAGDNFIASRGARGHDTVSIASTNIRMAPSKDESKLRPRSHVSLCSRLNNLFLGSKRKATDEPSTPSASKRIKASHSDSPEPKKIPAAGNPIPFPEKVSYYSPSTHKHNLWLNLYHTRCGKYEANTLSACGDRRAKWRD